MIRFFRSSISVLEKLSAIFSIASEWVLVSPGIVTVVLKYRYQTNAPTTPSELITCVITSEVICAITVDIPASCEVN